MLERHFSTFSGHFRDFQGQLNRSCMCFQVLLCFQVLFLVLCLLSPREVRVYVKSPVTADVTVGGLRGEFVRCPPEKGEKFSETP
jgi:hypothetical protein